MIQVLLNHGANINTQDRLGRTPLFLLSFFSSQRIDDFKLLLANNADRHVKANRGQRPIDSLRLCGQEGLIESYDKWPLAVSAGIIQQSPRQQDTVMLNPRLSQHQHALACNSLLLVRKLPVHEVAYEILGFLSPAAVEKIFLP